MSCEDEHYHGHGDEDGHGHGHNHGHSHTAPMATNESQSLQSKIDTSQVTALNIANTPEEVGKLFKKSLEKYQLKPVIKSDCDAQMIINIPFLNGSVKLFSVILRTNGDKYCPKTIKLWKNDRSIDFDNVNDKKPTYSIGHPHVGVRYNDGDEELPEVLEQDDEFIEHYVPRHIFTGVQQLTLFIEDIYDEEEDESHVHYIELRGEFTELTKDPVITIYELAANPADHKNMAAEESANYSLNQ